MVTLTLTITPTLTLTLTSTLAPNPNPNPNPNPTQVAEGVLAQNEEGHRGRTFTFPCNQNHLAAALGKA